MKSYEISNLTVKWWKKLDKVIKVYISLHKRSHSNNSSVPKSTIPASHTETNETSMQTVQPSPCITHIAFWGSHTFINVTISFRGEKCRPPHPRVQAIPHAGWGRERDLRFVLINIFPHSQLYQPPCSLLTSVCVCVRVCMCVYDKCTVAYHSVRSGLYLSPYDHRLIQHSLVWYTSTWGGLSALLCCVCVYVCVQECLCVNFAIIPG